MSESSSPPPSFYWAVREEPSYAEAVAKIAANVKRFDELARGAIWKIETRADKCPVVGDGPFRLSQSQGLHPGDPVVNIWFTINPGPENICSLWHVTLDDDPWAFLSEDEGEVE